MSSLRARKEATTTTTSSTTSNNDNKDNDEKYDKRILSTRQMIQWIAIGSIVVVLIFLNLQMHHGQNVESNNNNNIRSNININNNNKYMKKGSSSSSSFQIKESLFKSIAKQKEKRDKKGNIVHKSITTVNKEDLKGLNIKLPDNINQISYEDAVKGREKLIDILHDAGVEELDISAILSLPLWESVTKLYGGNDGPVIIGLETCQKFRETIPLDDASIGTAGMFNTGTNPFNMYLEANCLMPHNKYDTHGGVRWQVPWGKHTLADRKWTNTAGHDYKVNKTNVLPVAIVRDPYSWMQSMCKHPYAARWPHAKNHCPSLVPSPEDIPIMKSNGINEKDQKTKTTSSSSSIPVTINYNPPATFPSLAHYWTEWYKQYLNADYPRLIVRFEDLQFHAKEMIDIVCQCAGAVARDNDGGFTYIVSNGKWGSGHQKAQTNLITAMIKYGTDKNRFDGMTKEDIEFASHALDPELMELFQYEMPSV